MLKRKIEKDIVQWIRSGGRKALLLSGVRQSGKTFIIRECLSRMECDYIEYNLIREPRRRRYPAFGERCRRSCSEVFPL